MCWMYVMKSWRERLRESIVTRDEAKPMFDWETYFETIIRSVVMSRSESEAPRMRRSSDAKLLEEATGAAAGDLATTARTGSVATVAGVAIGLVLVLVDEAGTSSR